DMEYRAEVQVARLDTGDRQGDQAIRRGRLHLDRAGGDRGGFSVFETADLEILVIDPGGDALDDLDHGKGPDVAVSEPGLEGSRIDAHDRGEGLLAVVRSAEHGGHADIFQDDVIDRRLDQAEIDRDAVGLYRFRRETAIATTRTAAHAD